MSSLSSYLPSRAEVFHEFCKVAQMTVLAGVGYGIASFSVSWLEQENFRGFTEFCLKSLSTTIQTSFLGFVVTGALHIAWPNSALSKTALGVSCVVLGGVLGAKKVVQKGREDAHYVTLEGMDLSTVNYKLIPKHVNKVYFQGALSHVNRSLAHLPAHIKSVCFWYTEVQDIDLGQLPDSVDCVEFHACVNLVNAQLTTLKDSIKKVEFSKCDLTGIDLKQLPENCKHIILYSVSNADTSTLLEDVLVDFLGSSD